MNVLGRIFLYSRKDGVFLWIVEELTFLIILNDIYLNTMLLKKKWKYLDNKFCIE